MRPEAKPDPAEPFTTPLDAWSADPERHAIGLAIGQDRGKILFGAWTIIVIQFFVLLIAIPSREMPFANELALGLALTIQTVLAVVLHVVSERHIYGIVSAWITLIGIVLVAQLATVYFGPERELILRGIPSIVSIGVPPTIVLAASTLKPKDAIRFSSVLILSLMVVSGLHLWLYWDQAFTRYGMLLMLVTIYLISPFTMLLLYEHHRIYLSAHAAIHKRIAGTDQSQLRNEQERLRDPVTRLLNEAGIQEALSKVLAHQSRTAVASIKLTNMQNVLDDNPETDMEELLNSVAEGLRVFRSATLELGRLHAGEFVLWSTQPVTTDRWDRRLQGILESLKQDATEEMKHLQFALGAGHFERSTPADFVIQDIRFRTFSNSLAD